VATMDDNLERAAGWLRDARRVVVFTGAGVSAESGVPTFRDAGGVWSRFAIEDFATWEGIARTFERDPASLAEFILGVIEPIARAQPNPAHEAIAALERHKPVTVITQNVDALHQQAGSTRVCEVHGSIFDVVTSTGQRLRRFTREQMADIARRVRSAMHARLTGQRLAAAVRPMFGIRDDGPYRPSIVLFGDVLCEPDWTEAMTAAADCDLLISVGTSREVYPAAGLPDLARSNGARIISVDPQHPRGDLNLQAPAGQIMPTTVRRAFG
jgi:NAD-dependent deacetylase